VQCTWLIMYRLCGVYLVDYVPFQHINCSSFTVLMDNGLAQMIPQTDPDPITLIVIACVVHRINYNAPHYWLYLSFYVQLLSAAPL